MSTGAPFEERRPATAPSRDIQRDFWLSHMRIGFGIFMGETLFVMVYLGRHRTILWVVAILWFVCATMNLLFGPRLASWHRRAQFSASWNILAAFAVGGVAILDGGLRSPTILLLFLPAAFAALAFTPWVAGMCGVANLFLTIRTSMPTAAPRPKWPRFCLPCSRDRSLSPSPPR